MRKLFIEPTGGSITDHSNCTVAHYSGRSVSSVSTLARSLPTPKVPIFPDATASSSRRSKASSRRSSTVASCSSHTSMWSVRNSRRLRSSDSRAPAAVKLAFPASCTTLPATCAIPRFNPGNALSTGRAAARASPIHPWLLTGGIPYFVVTVTSPRCRPRNSPRQPSPAPRPGGAPRQSHPSLAPHRRNPVLRRHRHLPAMPPEELPQAALRLAEPIHRRHVEVANARVERGLDRKST